MDTLPAPAVSVLLQGAFSPYAFEQPQSRRCAEGKDRSFEHREVAASLQQASCPTPTPIILWPHAVGYCTAFFCNLTLESLLVFRLILKISK